MSINTYIRPSFLWKIHACSPYDPVAASTTVIPTTVSNSRVTPSNHKYGWLYHIVGYTSPDIWVNYNISPTWIKAIWGWFPILTMISSEVAVRSLWFTHILYIYIYQLYHMEKSSKDGNRTGQISRTCGWSSILFCAPLTMIHRYDL